MSLRQKHLEILSELVPAGIVGALMLLRNWSNWPN
jgi:hypothetical protein